MRLQILMEALIRAISMGEPTEMLMREIAKEIG